LELLGSKYENVVVDVPRAIDPRSYAAFRQADKILIVCQLLVPSMHNAKRLYDSLDRVGIPPGIMEIVINREASGFTRISKDDVCEMFGKPVFASIPNDFEFMARSLDLGRLAASMDRKNHVRTAMRMIAKELTSNPNDPEGQSIVGTRRGLLARLFQ
jgi:pilus assembly protein CpaE